MPFPIGFFDSIDSFIIASVDACEIKSKWGVCPLITHPSAINASYFFKFFEIVTGISKTPGTFIILTFDLLGKSFRALFNNPDETSL